MYSTRPQMFMIILVIIVMAASFVTPETRTNLTIGAVFPMKANEGGWSGGQACLPAAQMALDDINTRHKNIMHGYKLVMQWFDSECEPGLGLKKMYDLVYKDTTKLLLLTGCSLVTTVIAQAANMWNLIVLSYGASSPALSNRDRFPSLFRTHPSATLHNPTRIKLFKKFNWKKVAILQSVEEVFTSTAKDLERECRESNIEVLSRQSFLSNPRDAVQNLKRQDARIIVGLFYETEARKVFCEVYREGLYGEKYVWLLIGWYADNWYVPKVDEHINCTRQQMLQAVQYHFTTEANMLSQSHVPGISKLTGKQFQERLKVRIASNSSGFVEAPLAYDAIWSVALTFGCTIKRLQKKNMKLENFSYLDPFIKQQMFICMKQTNFNGVSGEVKFTKKGDRIARTQIEQMKDGQYEIMGFYDNAKDNLTWSNKQEFGNHSKRHMPPPDSTLTKDYLVTVHIALYIIVLIFCFLGLIAIILAALFNFKFGYRKLIKLSQPQCNNLTLAGCLLLFLSLVLFGLPVDGLLVDANYFSLLCHSRVLLMMVGFSFGYGAMFSKVWLAHTSGAASERPELCGVKDQPISMWKFYWTVACFVCIDLLLNVVWICADPMVRLLEYFPLESPPPSVKEDVKWKPILEHCQSKYSQIWIGLVFVYKGLLLLFGLFFAYENRSVKMRYMNDSRFVSLAIYNVAILSLVTGPVVGFLIQSHSNASFAFVSVAVLLCAFMSVALIFIPKVFYVVQVPASNFDDDVQSRKLTKEEEDRYKKLCTENDDIKRKIAEKEVRIKELRNLLEKRMSESRKGLRHRLSKSASRSSSNQIAPLTNTNVIDDVNNPTTLVTTLVTVEPSRIEPKQQQQQQLNANDEKMLEQNGIKPNREKVKLKPDKDEENIPLVENTSDIIL